MRCLKIRPFGDQAVMIKLGEQPGADVYQRIRAITAYLVEKPLLGMIEAVPGLTSVTVYYDPLLIADELRRRGDASYPYEYVQEQLRLSIEGLDEKELPPSRLIEIPVLYGEGYGPDLERVAQLNDLAVEEVIAIHSSAVYTVYMLGFTPGFPYLVGMDRRISAPRRASPRLKIPAGSVGIAGEQTGVYPLETPGGWNLIGRTPLPLLNPDEDPPTLLQQGDQVRFVPITESHYHELKREMGS